MGAQNNMLSPEERKVLLKPIKTKWTMIILLFFLATLVTQLGFAFYHEGIHEAIYDQYYVNHTMGFMFDPQHYYVPTFYVKTTDSSVQMCNEVCGSLQTENEIISYNTSAVIIALWCIFFVYLVKCIYDDFNYIQQQYGNYATERQ